MREEQYKKIDGTNYVCRPLPGWDGVGLFFDLVAMIGEPAMMMITRAFSDDEEDADAIDAGEIVGAGVYAFVSKLSAASGTKIMKQVFADVTYADAKGEAIELGNDADFNQHFKGETLRALTVFVWALQINFQSFLGASRLTGIFGKIQAAAKKAAGESDGEEESASNPETSPPLSPPSASSPTEASI